MLNDDCRYGGDNGGGDEGGEERDDDGGDEADICVAKVALLLALLWRRERMVKGRIVGNHVRMIVTWRSRIDEVD